MKRFAFKIALMIFVMLGISNYGFYLMTGKAPLLSGFKFPDFSKTDLNPLSSAPETAYKWVDENGRTHYSNEVPAQSQPAIEVIKVDPNTNIIQAVELPEEAEEGETTVITPVEGPLYKPENIQKLINDAKNVEKVLQERHKKQEEIINNL